MRHRFPIHRLVLCLFVLTCSVAWPSRASAQEPMPRNPTGVEWTCPDHDSDTQHELTIVRVEGTNKVVITTILLGDPAYVDAATKKVRSDLNVQPIAFGLYVATMVAVANTVSGPVRSDPSAESNQFERAPGKPGGVTIIR